MDPRKAVAGTRAVKRGLKDVEKSANKTEKAIRKMLAGFTVIFVIKQLVQLGDAFTNLQNRLRVVTDGESELAQVTEDLLQVANRSRSSFESTAELYSRLALATRELNLEGANLIDVTESINKAIILSGASAKEANNGLIQLSQGLASGRLTGDELRSTLEQLPVVADVIAKQLGVTRGELRKLGADGKITSIEIIRAFVAAKDELDAGFGKTVPTLGQSLVVLRNNVVAFVGRINEGTGILRGFGTAIRFVGTELEAIVKTLALVGATAGAIKLAPVVQSFFALNAAIKAGTAVRLGSIAAISAQNKLLIQQAAQTVATAAAELKRTDGVILQTRVESLSNAIKKGGNAILFEKVVVTRQLQAVEAQRTAQLAALIAAEKAQVATSLAATANVTIFTRALAGAKAGVIGLTRAIAKNPIGFLFVALTAIITGLTLFRNEIKLTEDGLGTLGDLFAEFFAQLSFALGHLRNLFVDAFRPLIDAAKEALGIIEFEFADLIRAPAKFVDRTIGLFLGLVALIPAIFGNLGPAVADVFITLTNKVIDAIEFLPDVFIGVVKTIGQILGIFITGQLQAFGLLARAAKAALTLEPELAASLAKEAGEVSANAFERATTGVGDRFIRNIAGEIDDELIPRLENTFEGGFGELGLIALNAFADAADFSGTSDFVDGLIAGANQRGADRAAAEATKAKAEADKAAAAAAAERAAAIAKILGPLAEENRLLGIAITVGQREADIQRKFTKVREDLAKAGVKVSAVQALVIDSTIRQNAARSEAISTAQGLQTAEQILLETLRKLKNAYDQGTISLQVFNEAQREAEITALEASKNFGDGWEAAIARATDKLSDFGQTAEDIVGNLIPGLVDSLGTTFQEGFSFIANTLTDSETSWTDYREAIKATFKSLIDGILAELGKLLAQKALLALLNPSGGAFGVTGGQIGPAVPPGFAHGGVAAANKPFIAGEDGPELIELGQTARITPTDQTMEALSGGAANNQQTVVVQAPAQAPPIVNNIIVDDPSKIPSGIESPDGRQAVRNVIREERSGIKRDLG